MSDDLAVLPVRDGDCGGDVDVPRVGSPGSEKDSEAHAGDAGPEGCADAGPEVVDEPAAEPVVDVEARLQDAKIGSPIAIISRRSERESFVDLDLKCPYCKLPAALIARYSSKTDPVYYHLVSETPSPDMEGCVDQVLMSCINALGDVIEDMVLVLSKKYMELME